MSKRNHYAGAAGAAGGELALAPPLAWELVRENIPAAPPQAAVMAAAALRADELGKLQRIGGRKMLRLAYALAIAFVLALCGGTVFWFGGRDQHTVWASAEGYVLRYDVFDRSPASFREMRAGLPNELSFKQEVRGWARQTKVQLSENGWIDAPRFIELQPDGSVSWPQKLWSNCYKLTMIGITEAERDDLISRLEPLAGVAPPVISENSEYYVSTGMPEALAINRVLINGAEYSFPKDFTQEEARVLRSYFWSCREEIRYAAFSAIDRGLNPRADRFDLGDVYKIELDDNGALVITTLVKVWEEGRILKNDPLFQAHMSSGQHGWSVAMSRALPEPGYDPLQALATWRNSQLLEKSSRDYPVRSTHRYEFFTPERMLAAGAPKYSAEEMAQTKALVAQLDDTLNAFQASHPEYWDKLVHRYRVSHNYSSFGAMPVQYQIHVSDSDGRFTQQVQALLSQIAGLPEVQVEQRDLREGVPPPFTREEAVTLPPLPPRNPAQWHTLSGYKLTCRVLCAMRDGERYYGETDQTRAFSHAVAQWATQHGLQINPPPSPVMNPFLSPFSGAPAAGGPPAFEPAAVIRFPQVALYMAEPGGGGEFGSFTEAVFTIYIAAPDRTLPDSLAAVLARLPGVAQPKVQACKFYIHDSHPMQPVMGKDLVLDGKRYRFPDDFAWEETLGLSMLALKPGLVQYKAFFTLVDPKRNRIKFPDVVRVESTADGGVEITTFKQDWPEGRALQGNPPNVYGGATVELPQGVAEASFDPLPALASQLRFYERKAPGKVHYSLQYFFAPREQWLELYQAAPDTSELARSRRRYAELDRRLAAWLAAHPECAESDTAWARVGWYDFPHSGGILGAGVYAYSDDNALARELAELLRDIPGLPEPVRTQSETTPQ